MERISSSHTEGNSVGNTTRILNEAARGKKVWPSGWTVDRDAIEVGAKWPERIREAAEACHVMLVLVGPRWAEVRDREETLRLADPATWVRLEVETGLQREDEIVVVPVLHDGAELPRQRRICPNHCDASSMQRSHAAGRRPGVRGRGARWKPNSKGPDAGVLSTGAAKSGNMNLRRLFKRPQQASAFTRWRVTVGPIAEYRVWTAARSPTMRSPTG